MNPRHVITLRWAPEVILALADGPRRFNWMLDELEGSSDRILTERLRDLDDLKLVNRQVDAGPPVRVWYRLTAAGERYIEPLRELARLNAGEVDELQEAAVG